MAKKQMLFKTKGMNRDLSVSAFNPEFAFENMNLRLSTNEGNTMMSWVNEKGTAIFTLSIKAEYWSKEGKNNVYINPNDNTWTHHEKGSTVTEIVGQPIGTAVINRQLVIFTTTNTASEDKPSNGVDYIYRLQKGSSDNILEGNLLFVGSLNLYPSCPIETLVSYESEAIQKVYWTDGKNQPRLINIADKDADYNADSFNFVRKLKLEETVKVLKTYDTSGIFAPGVIQYAFTYFSKYGQETAIFYTSPLLYVSHRDRGASPEDKVSCAFKITITNVDTEFDYIRVYSIQRTSINGTPICKRVQDISTKGLTNSTAVYTDTGTSGDSIDPTELLYKGGETVVVNTMESKDNTLFMGGVKIDRQEVVDLRDDIKNAITLTDDYREIDPLDAGNADYTYASQLTSVGAEYNNVNRHKDMTVPCGGFKGSDYYRCGIQFQHESGRWSDPIYKEDFRVGRTGDVYGLSSINGSNVRLPSIKGTLSGTITKTVNGNNITVDVLDNLRSAGYKKVRPVVVFPDLLDRTVVCQGVANPTLYTDQQRNEDHSLYAQSSWFFRPYNYDEGDSLDSKDTISPKSSAGYLYYTSRGVGDYYDDSPFDANPPEKKTFPAGIAAFDPKYLRGVEIEGEYSNPNKYNVDWYVLTMHSPDIEFDELLGGQLSYYDFANSIRCAKVGYVTFEKTLCDIDIQTDSPTISNFGKGFESGQLSEGIGAAGIVSGLFYDDLVVDDNDDSQGFEEYNQMKRKSSAKWLVYLWQANGSLNNDVTRPSGKGTASAILKKKIISNLRYASTTIERKASDQSSTYNPYGWVPTSAKLFSSDENTIVKINYGSQFAEEGIYRGNIDTAITPDYQDGKYFAFEGIKWGKRDGSLAEKEFLFTEDKTYFKSNRWLKTFNGSYPESTLYTEQEPKATVRIWNGKGTAENPTEIWDWDDSGFGNDIGRTYRDLVLKKQPVRIKYKSTPHLVFYLNGTYLHPGDTASQTNRLLVAEMIQQTSDGTRFGGTSEDALRENTWLPCGEPVSLDDNGAGYIEFYYDYGDTYFQRWDCLKTYAFTPEDINQVVEIGSFMLETHVNIDGRYDRNRGQTNNLNASPQNFNLINPVYSQKDNFFSYKIQDEDSYHNNVFPNQVYYSKTKTSGADVDQWTNITLASMLELDGDKGAITRLMRYNDQLIAFQDSGISQILYNENVQIASTTGVPIEIANSQKVHGKRYLSDTIGCRNKWSVVSGSNGIYFMDSNNKNIFLFNGQLTNLSATLGFNAWCKQEIENKIWKPVNEFNDSFVSYYDRKNQEVLFINKEKALAYSERFGMFTSFYSYGNTPYFCNLEDTGVWVKPVVPDGNASDTEETIELWGHQMGDEYCKFFDHNEDYWMTLVGNPEPQTDKIFTNLEFRASVDGDGEYNANTDKFTPALPFDSLEVWNEYQHGKTELKHISGHAAMVHDTKPPMTSALKRKFRIWRCDIPRDNAPIDPSNEAEMGIYRKANAPHIIDRMRNPWLYLKLLKSNDVNKKTEIHDMMMTYFN